MSRSDDQAQRMRWLEAAREARAELPPDPYDALIVAAALYLDACEATGQDPAAVMQQARAIFARRGAP